MLIPIKEGDAQVDVLVVCSIKNMKELGEGNSRLKMTLASITSAR